MGAFFLHTSADMSIIDHTAEVMRHMTAQSIDRLVRDISSLGERGFLADSCQIGDDVLLMPRELP